MVYPTKKLTASASATTRPPPSTSSIAHVVSGSGLNDLLFAASAVTVDTKSRDVATVAQLEEKCTEEKATVQPTIVTIDHNGGVEVEEESSGLEGKEKEVSSSEYKYNSENSSASLSNAFQPPKIFPRILHEILSTPECQPIVHWLPDGLSFIIADKQRFSDEILPTYFNRGVLRSFIRKLNRWGFRRVKSRRKGEESSFAHNSFVRDKPGLCSKMKCNSKPSYHKAPSTKKNKDKAKVVTIKAKSLSNAVAPSQAPPSLATTGDGIVNVGSCFPGTPILSAAAATTANIRAGGFPNAAITAAFATAIRDRSFLASFRPQNPQQQQQLLFLGRQLPINQIHQGGQDYLLQVQAELHRLCEMPSFNDNYLQVFMMAQYGGDLMRRNTFYS